MKWENKNTCRWPILLVISVPNIFLNGQFYFSLSSSHGFLEHSVQRQARNVGEWRKRWDLTADDDSSLLTRCRRVPLVHELLLLTISWSRLANRVVRLERTLRRLSNVNFCGVVDNKNTAGPIKRPSSSTITFLHNTYNRFRCFLLQVPQTFN